MTSFVSSLICLAFAASQSGLFGKSTGGGLWRCMLERVVECVYGLSASKL